MSSLSLQPFLLTFCRHPLEIVLSVAVLTPNLPAFRCLALRIFLGSNGLGLAFPARDRNRVSDEKIRTGENLIAEIFFFDCAPISLK